ncbi:prolyl 4-hydroxylase subunit alpha-1-like isoform X2 [Arctopsyche grandis]|uniref:prolyl 4-hydroxylase subunit alpha-1-like isoform X2 n=1 Tax=Arctopsyche grandis TaxID=121162 RepID=UPI00406D6B04
MSTRACLAYCFYLFVTIGLSRLKVQAEIFTALAELEPLLESESILLDSMGAYVRYQENRLNLLKEKYTEYEEEHRTAMNDVTNYLSNPVNAFKIIKRLTSEWNEVEELMTDDVGNKFVRNITSLKENVRFPTEEDLSGAAAALVRLQDTYRLDTNEVAKGKLNGIKYSSDMSVHDCFEIGRQSYISADYDHTEKWMDVALNKLNAETNKTVPKSEILEYLAFSNYMIGNVDRALSLTNELLEIIPDHVRAKGNIPHYEKALREKRETREDSTVEKTSDSNNGVTERSIYEELCRDEMVLPESVKKDLKCFYYFGKRPFSKIAPFKVEQHYLDPDIISFHNILSEKEMEFVKESAKPRFKRATVQDSETGELVVAKYRISKSAWLKDNEHEVIAKISRRVSDMTGLSMETAEELQVVNYGIGGHYEPHFDFARKEEKSAFGGDWGNGNRIATVLFYMSDVAQGGGTVFPELGLSVKPKKGAGVFWFNLFPSGDGNYATRHAACPVLQGSKWVSNKWIHQKGQEFLTPCNLEHQEEGMSRVFPKPVKKGAITR